MEKITLSGVPETMLQTVFARAQESRKPEGKIRDPRAEELISRLDYDFSLAAQDKTMSMGVVARTIVLDRLVKRELEAHPDAAVVNIACGLDTRCSRLDNGRFRWYNLDLPEVIALREKLLPESGRISQLACSAMNPDWAAQIADDGRPVLVIVEGLTMYLTEGDVQKIFSIIAGRFPKARVLAETMNPLVVKRLKEKSIEGSNAKFRWGVKNGPALAALLPEFAFAEEHSLAEGMAVLIPAYRLLEKIPLIRNISNKIIVLDRA